jgi:hypothetical protein
LQATPAGRGRGKQPVKRGLPGLRVEASGRGENSVKVEQTTDDPNR